MVTLQKEDFSVGVEYEKLKTSRNTGAIVTFTGLVRDFSESSTSFYLQHYPGMTEKVLNKIELEACNRWPLLASTIIHRVGHLEPGDQIVFVGAAASHREDAFNACQFMIDILKTDAPFWKKEGDTWVEAKDSDNQRSTKWLAQISHQLGEF